MIVEHGTFSFDTATGRILGPERLDWMSYANSRCEWDTVGNPIKLPGTTFALVSGGAIIRINRDPTALVPNGEMIVETDQEVSVGMIYAAGALAPAPSAPVPVIVLLPADLWRRATDVEAEAIDAAMAEQPVRLRNLFRSAQTYQSDDPLWPLLNDAAVQLFGEARAAELLAASR